MSDPAVEAADEPAPKRLCVVLDRAHVEALRDTLVTWLDAEERF